MEQNNTGETKICEPQLYQFFRLPQRSEEASQTTSGSADAAADSSSNFITRDWLDLGQNFKKHMTPLIFMNFSKTF